jgi:DNA-binding transcriptional ArsR family regulator
VRTLALLDLARRVPIGFSGGPKPPPGIDRQTWRKVPLAKRRLIVEGPLDRDHPGIFDAALIIAAELRLQGVPEDVALEVVRAMPLDVPPQKQHRERRQFPKAVNWAYNPSDGIPVYTGCPRGERHSGAPQTSRLRQRFERYCDDDCAKTCRIRQGGAIPAAVLIDSPFWNVLQSSIWAKLGPGARLVYERLASLAALNPDGAERPVWAARRYLAGKLGYTIPQSTITDHLAKLRSLGLIDLVNKRRGHYIVSALTDAQVNGLESFLRTSRLVKQREQEAKLETLAYSEWTYDWDDADEMVAGTGACD